ncbi:MAG TPA: hypothetical protein VGG26_09540 [Terracidiphilus sp.]|jgi:hypothetical protein
MDGGIPQKANPENTGGVNARLPNGPGAAAVLAAGVGSFAVGLFAVAADKSAAMKGWMIFSKPTGPLSGVTTSAIVVWLIAWILLHARWRGKTVALRPVNMAALLLLALGLLLTFPLFADLL